MNIDPKALEAARAAESAKREALALARELYSRWFRDAAPHWEPFSDVCGLISQIDNMTAGMGKKLDAQAAEIERLKRARRPFNDAFAERVIDAQVKEIDRLHAALAAERAKAREASEIALEKMRAALETIAESHDAGRHDGLPEPCPAHDADTMWAIATQALDALTTQGGGE